MWVLGFQIASLIALAVALTLWARAWPYPSPLIRWLLSPQQRWPEAHVRKMLDLGRLHPRYLKFFNRDPLRTPPPGQDLVAPADGLLLSANVRDGIRYVVIALSFWDVHVQRCPVAGRVRRIETLGDRFRDGEGRDFAFLEKKNCPVQKRIVIEADGVEIAVRLITSLAARRIEVWPKVGERLDRGERLGRILLGSTVVLETPVDQECLVQPGERVVAGETILVEAKPRGSLK